MINYFYKINRHLHKLYKYKSKSELEIHTQKILKDRVATLALATDSSTQWLEFQKKLITHIKNEDPINFLNWDVIRETMFYRGHLDEYMHIKNSINWEKIKKNINEDRVGRPEPFLLYRKSSGNLIHCAYELDVIINILNIEIGSINSIFEFGGGYGSMCRYIYRYGFLGKYHIFDLAIFSMLQEYFLSNTSLENIKSGNISLIYKQENLSDINDVDLFLALWSFSETPLDFRNNILDKLPNAKMYAIGYQEKYYEVDNILYFDMFKKLKPNYEWTEVELTHEKGSKFLIGKIPSH
ncbi:MAG: hypothetical protein NW207_01890 [Cytophagales bacterium]|nr:hypothetical protein [Cytophagales bacterium]